MKIIRKLFSSIALTLTLAIALSACGASNKPASSQTQAPTQSPAPATQTPAPAQNLVSANVEIKGTVDLVPHSELVNYVKDKLEAEGVTVTLVSTAADETTNERTEAGEVDFNFFQHFPYLSEWNEINGGHLVNAGDIHVEPISAYSDKYKTIAEIPADAKIAIPNNATNEYRALRILEIAGFLKLDDEASKNLKASVSNVKEYLKSIELVELDSATIIPTKDDFDVFITNVNKVLEAGIDSAVLFKEGEDSPYANIIAVRSDLAADKRAAVDKLVKALQSDDTRSYILEHYNGQVIPAQLSSAGSTTPPATAAQEISYPSAVDPKSVTNFKYGKIQIPGKGGALCGIPVYIAYEKGFFAAEGFDVELISADTETRKIGLNNGTIPVVNGDFQFFQSIENGVNVSVVEGLHKGCIKLLVKADSDIKTVADLKGKKIGIDEVGGTPHQVAALWLEKAGISADQAKKEVTFLPFEEGNLEVEALRSGDIDVAALWDPFASVQEASGDYRAIFDLATDPLFADHYCCFLYASNKWIEEKPEQVAALLRAYRAAEDWIARNPEEAVQIVIDGKYSSIDDQKELAIELVKHYAIPQFQDHGTAAYDIGGDVKYFAQQLYDIGYLTTNPEDFVKQAYYAADLSNQ
jgi:NitT/TauT family transport system substrate-binding protein